MDPVVHFEMPAEDRERMANFYSSVFGWQTHMFGPDMGNYTVVTTTESDESGRPTVPGAINGGFYVKTEDVAAQSPSVVIAVDDVAGTLEAITRAGGRVIGTPQEIPGVGMYGGFYDTEGNRVSVLQPDQSSSQSQS